VERVRLDAGIAKSASVILVPFGELPGLLALCRWQFGPMVAITLLDWRRARWRLATVALGYLLMLAPSCGSTMSCSGPGCRSARRARLYIPGLATIWTSS
jgi:hypothetical protein